MGVFRPLTDQEAQALNRGQLHDRLVEENTYWERRMRSRRPLSDVDRRAMRRFGELLHRYTDLGAMLDHTIALAGGRCPPDYLLSRVDGSPPRPPYRVQLSRRRGYQLPYGVRVVTRPGRFGNPFRGVAAVEEFRRYLAERNTSTGQIVYAGIDYPSDEEIARLAYWDLGCWCALTDEPGLHCHADVLLGAANPEVIRHG